MSGKPWKRSTLHKFRAEFFARALIQVVSRAPVTRRYVRRKHQRTILKHVNDLLENATETDFRRLTGVDQTDFRDLLRLTSLELGKAMFRRRKRVRTSLTLLPLKRKDSITPKERLFLCLCWLRSGTSFTWIAAFFALNHGTLRQIVFQTLTILLKTLRVVYDIRPKSKKDWKAVADRFFVKWQLPHVCGCVDGKHCKIKGFNKGGSTTFNYLHFHSVILMATVDADCKFIRINAGAYGSRSDGGVYQEDLLGADVTNGKASRWLPNPSRLPNDNSNLFGDVGYYFIGDDAFAVTKHFLKPFTDVEHGSPEDYFNYRLSRARCTVEATFGQMANRFMVFTGLRTGYTMTKLTITTCCHLHNYLKIRNPMGDEFSGDESGLDRRMPNFESVLRRDDRESGSEEGKTLREIIKRYCVLEKSDLLF